MRYYGGRGRSAYARRIPKQSEAESLVAGTISATVESATSYSATGTAPQGGDGGPYTHQWHEGTTSGFTPSGGNAISGATSQNLPEQTGKTTGVTLYLKRVDTDGSANTAVSNQANVTPSDVTPFFETDFADQTKTGGGGFEFTGGGMPVSDTDEAPGGGYALRFQFLSTTDIREQRFSLPSSLAQFWIEYDWYIPANFSHGTTLPSNNKLFRVWQGGASDGTFSVTTEFPASSSCTGCSGHRMIAEQTGGSTTETTPNPLIAPGGPIVIGQWNTIRFGFKAASGLGNADGFYRMWVGDTVVSELADFEFWNTDGFANTYIEAGYFMGWANTRYAETTTFYITRIKCYDTDPGWPTS